MKRLVLDFLEKWRTKKDRRPLLIRGARQVGKTWLVRAHAQAYSNFVEINFEAEPEYQKLFKEFYGKPEKLIPALSLLSGKKIEPGSTLLFLDEIQESKEALLSLRYFKEKLPEQHVISAGSLLEFSFQDFSFPVGRIEFLYLFPMNFEEYLMATGKTEWIETILHSSENVPLTEVLHEKLLEESAIYAMIGGMPEIVKTYAQSQDLQQCQELQQIHVTSFREDFHKYASKANIEYLRLIFSEIPRLFGQKFKYSNIDSTIKSRELSHALTLLEKAGLVYKIHHSSCNGLPLESESDLKKFKVFFVDIGLAQRILGLSLATRYLKRRNLLIHQGGMAEQWTAQELLSYTLPQQAPKLHYWHREAKSAQAEVDFVIEHESSLLPIEVKSLYGGHLKSLHLFLKEKGKNVSQALKISQLNFSKQENIIHLPFYALMKIGKASSV